MHTDSVSSLRTPEAIARGLQTPGFKKTLLASQPVVELYSALGRKPPIAT